MHAIKLVGEIHVHSMFSTKRCILNKSETSVELFEGKLSYIEGTNAPENEDMARKEDRKAM